MCNNKCMNEEKKNSKKIKKALIATTAASSIIINQTFDEPMDIIQQDNDPEVKEIEETNKELTFKQKVKKMITSLPIVVKIIFVIPLWLVGWLLIIALKKLWAFGFETIVSKVCYWIIVLLVILTILFIAKCIFLPDVKLKDMFNKKTLLAVISCVGIFAIGDYLLETTNTFYFENQDKIKFAYCLFVIITILIVKFIKHQEKTITLETDSMQIVEKVN